MILNKISAVITQEQESQVIKLIKEARDILDFLVSLNSNLRIRLAKLSRGRVDFVDTSLVEAKTNPKHLPSYFTLDEFIKDVKLKSSLHHIRAELEYFTQRIDDTILMVEAEAYRKSRLFYNSVKAAGKAGEEDAERIAKYLSYHYKKLGHPKNSKSSNNDNDNDNGDNIDNGLEPEDETVLKDEQKELSA